MPIRPKNMPDDMPAELMAAADERDAMVDEQLDGIIPAADSPYNVKVLTSMAEAVQAIASLMGIDVEVEQYNEATTRLDDDVARFLFMASKAAEDYGKPFPVKLEDIKGDNELTSITAHMKMLAADEDFKKFLQGEAEPEGAEVEVTVEAGPRDDAEDLFMSRMR